MSITNTRHFGVSPFIILVCAGTVLLVADGVLEFIADVT